MTLDAFQYYEIFRDDFGATSIDQSKWGIIYGGSSANGAFTWSGDNLFEDNGQLTVSMKNAATGWTVGGMRQGGPGNEYGLYQVRAKMDVGQGIGPALLLWPSSNIWPGPEVDLLESPDPNRAQSYFSLHWRNPDGGNSVLAQNYDLDVTQWHTYALDWEPDHLTYYIDGNALFTTSSNIPKEAETFALQGFVAASDDTWYGGGPDVTTPSEIDLHVDWVSISKANIEPIPVNDVIGSGPDNLILNLSEDAWQGDALFIASIDGQTLGGAQAVLAYHSKGETEAFSFAGNFGPQVHQISIEFVNDAYGGSYTTDRNLYVESTVYNGHLIGQPTAMYWNQVISFKNA